MKTAAFDYELPPELIAQEPPADRAGARMLVLRRASGACQLRRFRDLASFLRPGDCLVLNDTRVIPARLFGQKEGGGARIEALLLSEEGPGLWEAMLRNARRLRPGTVVQLDGAPDASFTVEARHAEGHFLLRFSSSEVLALLERAGHVPLPPYIQRQDVPGDRQRYQTVFAARPGAVAAPTAGLHFTPEVLAELSAAGVRLATVTLHVGPGTFKPVTADDLGAHRMHEERYELSEAAAALVNRTRSEGGRIVAVGTTAVRVLETCAQESGLVLPGAGRTRLFLHPPQRPRSVDALLTNFHLPRSTLLMLVACFSTTEQVLAAYRLAVQERFRFYSYGDCMLLI